MKTKEKSRDSLNRYFGHVTHMITMSEHGILSRKEIEDKLRKWNVCKSSRQVTDILKAMILKEYLERAKIKGTKREGYTIKEEIIGKRNESYFTSGVTKSGKPIYTKLTQKQLQKEIKNAIKEYKNQFKVKKSEQNTNLEIFYARHYNLIVFCLSWISRLKLSIVGGVFHDKTMKIALANTNIKLLEEFMESLLTKVHVKNPENYDLLLTSLMNYFEYLDPFENTPYSRLTKSS